MENRLNFLSLYKSITRLPEVSLPSFVVLTGKNGSGKTHLLEAIVNGHIKSSVAPNHSTDILMFDWNNIIPRDTGVFHPHQVQTQRANWFGQIRTQQNQVFPNIRQEAINLGIPADQCSTLDKICSISVSKLEKINPAGGSPEAVHQKMQEILQRHGQQIYNQTTRNIGDDQWKKLAPEVARVNPLLFLETSEAKFFNDKRFLWSEVDIFQQAFGRLFSNYRDLIHQNDRLEKYPPKGASDLRYLSGEKFVEAYGEPPWDFVNNILEICNLDFRVEPPPLHEVSSYEPRLKKISSDIDMRFQDLSSGEKVLMSFALCLYNASDTRQEKRFPKLLLLDEVDAPLHPSMTLSLLNTIQTILVGKKGITVFLTTHSPSTVALAPEDSLFEMNPVGPNVEKCSKGRALSILTTGVPTLSVSFDGRRQVFVESKVDAKLYEKLYLSYKGKIDSDRSLTFIEVGYRSESGTDINAGCNQVIRIVTSLVENGNQSVFGLVDWDGKVSPTKRMKVLSPTIRDGIESLMLDPVLVAAMAIKESIVFSRQKGLIGEDEVYTSISDWDSAKWRVATEAVQDLVVGSEEPEEETLDIEYLDGMKLTVRKKYLHMDDHELERKVLGAFGFIVPKSRRTGDLLNYMHDSILSDHPGLLPRDLIETFESLLQDLE